MRSAGLSGHVFHPGHEELHGITVVVEGDSTRRYIGRFHETSPRGLIMHDVAVHDAATSDKTWEEFLARTLKFGVKIEHKQFVIPEAEATRVIKLLEYSAAN